MRTDFAVIGAGLFGLSAAWALTRRGHEVAVIDQAPVGHLDGGSHGTCRIFRLGYETSDYVRLARQARDTWTELEEACAEVLLHPTPQLTFGPELERVRLALEEAGAPGELLSDREVAERFTGIAVPGPVLYEQNSAVIAADRALAALAMLSGSADRPAVTATSLAEHGKGIRISTTDGDLDADRVIVCAGPWTSRLTAGLGVTVPSAPTMQQVCYFDPAEGKASGRADAGPTPIFIHYGGDFPYGLPVPGSDRYKIGIHSLGPAVDPDHQDHSDDAGLVRMASEATAAFLPGFNPEPAGAERCIYDNSPDGDFIIDRVGALVIAAGTSGHGFKFGPLAGEWLATLATGDGGSSAGQPPPQFALSRF